MRNVFDSCAVLAWLASACVATPDAQSSTAPALVSSAGDRQVIPGWHIQSTQHIPGNISGLSLPGADISSWYRVGSRATVMAGLVESGVYKEADIFFSDNLQHIGNSSELSTAWVYREEFNLNPITGQRIFLQTHGVTSRGDIYINGAQVASSDVQVGSYGGLKYDVTKYVHSGSNCILIKAYPTNYLRDFAIGFVDWNPYPADNGTGVWRNVELLQTGQLSLSPPRIITDFAGADTQKVTVTVKIDVRNNGDQPVKGKLEGLIRSEDQSQLVPLSTSFSLQPREEKTVSMAVPLANPKIWWPALWGGQPLYRIAVNASVSGIVSDIAEERTFGIRKIVSQLNSHNDTEFTVNGQPFLVMGAGYSTDMFLRFDENKVKTQFQYMLDMGLNTVRLEGKQEQPELYDLADQMGLMVMAGWECCDKWEGWTYNDEADGVKWKDEDYGFANHSMLHEAMMMQSHPSMLAFLVGSDFWPDDRAAKIYVDALQRMDWVNPIIASAAKRGYPEILGPSGMKMDGPYDWVPPNYWYGDQLGAAFGFGSELGAGVGTPELGSLKKFLSTADMKDLWTKPEKGLFHMSSQDSQFYDRSIYNKALYARYGKPVSLDDYLLKAQMMDYEATRSEFEAYAARKNADPPATGAIYWMLNGAWPNLHWNLFDYYLKPAGSFFGTKVAARPEHVSYDYDAKAVYIINHSLVSGGKRNVLVSMIDANGKSLAEKKIATQTTPNQSKQLSIVPGIDKIQDIAFLKLVLQDDAGVVLSRNTYWLTSQLDVLDWDNSTWYHTPVTNYVNYTAVTQLSPVSVTAKSKVVQSGTDGSTTQAQILLENTSSAPAFFLRLNLLDESGADIVPVSWSDNYVTLWPKEKLQLTVDFAKGLKGIVEISGSNVRAATVKLT